MSGYKRARFHAASGPESLFRRVHQKMDGHRSLSLPSRQLQKKWTERGIPVGELKSFQSDDWELMTAEVRADRGKFIASGWRRPCNGSWLWILIGMNDLIEHAAFKQGRGQSDDVVSEGELFEYVRDVNEELVESEPWLDSWGEDLID